MFFVFLRVLFFFVVVVVLSISDLMCFCSAGGKSAANSGSSSSSPGPSDHYAFNIEKVYYHDMNSSVEASMGYKGNFKSLMKINTARQINLVKCQQLTCHEFTHHIQHCLLNDLQKKFPEFEISIGRSPMGMLLEATAELAVKLMFPKQTRIKHLKKIIDVFYANWNNKNELINNCARLVEIDDIITQLWSLYTLTCKNYVNGHISKLQVDLLMKTHGMKPKNSWPNSDFFEKYRSYIIGYGWGKTLVESYLKCLVKLNNSNNNSNNNNSDHNQQEQMWSLFEQFLRFPQTPQFMLNYIKSNTQHVNF